MYIYINGIIYKDDPLLLWDNMGKCGIIYIYSTPRIFGIIVVNEMSGWNIHNCPIFGIYPQ